MLKTIHYGSREELVAAIRNMMARKREWVEQSNRAFEEIRQRQQFAIPQS